MIEHLDRREVRQFLKEARRILTANGIIRIAVPDINILIDKYLQDGDADDFIEKSLLTMLSPRSLKEKIVFLIVGHRNHKWMYDGKSSAKLLESGGFINVRVMEPGSTNIPDPAGLDLYERAAGSVYVEATNP